MPIYISSLFSKKGTSRQSRSLSLEKKISLSFPIKNLFFESNPFAAHNRNQQVVVFWERSAIKFSYQCSKGVFSLRIAFARFNPGSIFLPLIYFFLVLIVWYNALLIYVMSIKIILLLLFCYLIKGFPFFFLFISFIFILFSNIKHFLL